MVAFRSADASGRQSGLLLRCVLYCLLAIGLMILDKRYNQLSGIRRALSVVVYPLQVAVASPFEGWDWLHDSVRTRDALRADKARLEQELRMARFRLQRYDALDTEVRKLPRAAREHRRRDAEVHCRRRHERRPRRVPRADPGRQGRARRRLRRPGCARRGRRVRPGVARLGADLRGDPDQRRRARDPRAGQPQRAAHGRGRHRRRESAEAALRVDQRRHRQGRPAGDARSRRRVSGRLPGGHRRRRAPRSGRVARRGRRAAGGGARPLAPAAVHLGRPGCAQ